MMKPVAAVCALSVAVNLGFVAYTALGPRISPPMVAEKAVTSSPSAGVGLSLETRQLLTGAGTENLDLLRDRLRIEGLPESIVRDVVSQRLWSARQAMLDAADPIKKRPWWQQTQEQLPGDDVRMTRLAESSRIALRARMKELFSEPEADEADPIVSFLPLEKQRALQKLRRDYAELRGRLDAETGSYAGSGDLAQREYLRDEEEKDIKTLLTAEENAERRLRDRAELSDHKKTAAIFDLSETQFRALLAAERRLQRECDKIGEPRDDPFAARSPEEETAIRKLQEEGRQERLKLIGAEKRDLYEAVEFNKSEYESVARYVARYDLPPAKVKEYYNFFRRWIPEQQAAIEKAGSRVEQQQTLLTLLRKIEAPMTELMGPAIMDSDLEWAQLIRSTR